MSRQWWGNPSWLTLSLRLTLQAAVAIWLTWAGGSSQELLAAEEAAAEAPAEPAAEKRLGRFISIPSPITDRVDRRVRDQVRATIEKAKAEQQSPVFVFEILPGKTEIGQALDLARFISGDELNGATTVAYVPETISGHNILVAMACQEIVMKVGTEIGEAGKYEKVIEPYVRDAYRQIASRRKTVPEAIALSMLDPAVEVVKVETDNGRQFVLSENLAEFEKKRSVGKPTVVKPAGKPGLFTAEQARELGFVGSLAKDRQDVALTWKLPREALADDSALQGNWRPVRCYLKGPITPKIATQLESMIQTQIRDRDVNFICLWIESAGGSPADSMHLANFLADLDPSKQRTVAYVPSDARGDAAFVALACDQIIMRPDAILGGSGDAEIAGEDIQLTATSLERIAKAKLRSTTLARAMVDPGTTVFRFVRKTDEAVNYWTEAEAADQQDHALWRKDKQITKPGQALHLNGHDAEDEGIATGLVEDFAEFRALYGLENDPQLIEPGWATALIDVLNSPGVTWLLLAVGLVALYIELHAPGVGLGGIVGAICFLLYFWSAYLGGTAGWLEILLFVAGLVCIAMEFLVFPGLTIFGLTGAMLMVASVVLASQTFVLPHNDYQAEHLIRSLKILVAAGGAAVVAALLVNRYLPHTPMFNRMLLAPPSAEELSNISRREALAGFDHLLGVEGQTATPLMPAGKARFGDQLVDVIAAGEFIDRNKPVVVIEARGNRVIVRPLA